jgi:hypothetical protein
VADKPAAAANWIQGAAAGGDHGNGGAREAWRGDVVAEAGGTAAAAACVVEAGGGRRQRQAGGIIGAEHQQRPKGRGGRAGSGA